MLRTRNVQPSLWESVLPKVCLRLPAELERVDAWLDDERFFTPFVPHFTTRLGRPSIPMETYLRLMFLKHRYRLGYESLGAEVSDSISWRRFCRIDIDGRLPHPTTLMRLTTRCGEAAIAELNEQLLAKAVEARVVKTGKVRADTTVVSANVDYPTDSGLLARAVRRMSRLAGRIRAAGGASRTPFRDRTRAAGRRVRSIAAPLAAAQRAGPRGGAGHRGPHHQGVGEPGPANSHRRARGTPQRPPRAEPGDRPGEGPAPPRRQRTRGAPPDKHLRRSDRCCMCAMVAKTFQLADGGGAEPTARASEVHMSSSGTFWDTVGATVLALWAGVMWGAVGVLAYADRVRVRPWVFNGSVGVIGFGVVGQIGHIQEHIAQAGYWVVHPNAKPWMTPWGDGLAAGFGQVDPAKPSLGMEILHLTGNFIFLAGLAGIMLVTRRATRTASRRWARMGVWMQGIHGLEHLALTLSVAFGAKEAIGLSTWFGTLQDGPGLWTYRIWWHAIANLVGSIIFAIALCHLWRERKVVRAAHQPAAVDGARSTPTRASEARRVVSMLRP
jgi:IS5 family transposase